MRFLSPSPTFLRSALTSLFTTALDFGVLIAAVEIFKINYVLATWLGTIVGSLSNFTINKYWAFKGSPVSLPNQLVRFVLVQTGASALHTLGVWVFTRFGGLPYQVSKMIIAVAVAVGWNYPMNRRLVFATAGSRRVGATPPDSSPGP